MTDFEKFGEKWVGLSVGCLKKGLPSPRGVDARNEQARSHPFARAMSIVKPAWAAQRTVVAPGSPRQSAREREDAAKGFEAALRWKQQEAMIFLTPG